MSIAITESRSKTFHALGSQMNDMVIQNLSGKIIVYVIDKNSFYMIKGYSIFSQFEPSSDKFVNPECHKGVYIFSGTINQLKKFLTKNLEFKIEIVPKYFFEESIKII